MSNSYQIQPNLMEVIDNLSSQLAEAIKRNALLESHIKNMESQEKRFQASQNAPVTPLQFRQKEDPAQE